MGWSFNLPRRLDFVVVLNVRSLCFFLHALHCIGS